MTLLRQGQLSFRSGYKVQTRWGASEAAVFWLEGIGGCLVALALLFGGPPLAVWIGVAMIAVAVVLLFHHLGNPRVAWKAIRNLRHSWISRGTVILGAFVGLGAVYTVFGPVLALVDGAEPVARWLLIASGVFIPLYPGLMLSSSPAIPFWNSGLLPVLSLTQGLASALAVLPLMGGAGPLAGASPAMAGMWALVLHTVVLALYLATMRRRGGAAARSVGYLMRGHAGLFWGGCVALGLLVPAASGVAVATGGAAALLAVAAVSRLIGDLALRRAMLKVGLFDPVI